MDRDDGLPFASSGGKTRFLRSSPIPVRRLVLFSTSVKQRGNGSNGPVCLRANWQPAVF